VAHPQGSQAVKVGVRLARQPDDLGEWLTDGSAFEAAGADALWLDLASEPRLDPLAVTAALAALTFRSLLVTTLPGHNVPPQALARTLATIGRLSRGRLRILGSAVPFADFSDGGSGPGIFRRVPGDIECFEHTRGLDEAERWVSAPAPDGRAAWRATLLDAAERGFRGLVVPADPRLLDILRNPDDHGDRHDLQLAQG
jgi:Luciferase-like monooxygenase